MIHFACLQCGMKFTVKDEFAGAKEGEFDDKAEIVKELGDVLWYVNAVAHLLGSSLEEVARLNNEKLASRQARNQLHGDGDNR